MYLWLQQNDAKDEHSDIISNKYIVLPGLALQQEVQPSDRTRGVRRRVFGRLPAQTKHLE